LKFKGTPSQEEHKTVFNGLKICKIALSNRIDFLAFFHLRKTMTTEIHKFWNTTIRYRK
jgi:hypothetical protein